jgi:hypothetical protein
MQTSKTNWLAVLVGALVTMGLGMLWYGFLFQKQWMAGNNITMEGEKYFKNGVEMPMTATPMIFNTVAMLVYALVVNWLIQISNSTTLVKGALVGGAIGLVQLVGVFVGNMFAANPTSLSMVDGSYSFLGFLLLGIILGGWRKK